MTRATWTPIAETDLEEILYHIAFRDRRPETGDRIYFELKQAALAAAQSPHGHVHPSAPADWLYIRHKRWLIFYQPHPEGIEVHRVLDAVHDLPTELSSS